MSTVAGMKLEMHGFEELGAALREMPKRVVKRIVGHGLKAGTDVIAAEMKSRTPVSSMGRRSGRYGRTHFTTKRGLGSYVHAGGGLLRDSVGSFRFGRTRNPGTYSAAAAAGGKLGEAYYVPFVELGFNWKARGSARGVIKPGKARTRTTHPLGHVAGRRFMRDSFDAMIEPVTAIMKMDMDAGIAEAWDRDYKKVEVPT